MAEAADPPETPAQAALATLLQGRDVLDGVILGADGELLAGEPELAEPAQRLLAAAPDADDIEVSTLAGAVYAARSAGHAVAVVCRRPVLPSLMSYDLRMALAGLDADADARAAA